MPSTLIDLRPDRRLLDLDFEGYKLNLQSVPHYIHDLPCPVDRVYPDDVQYSFIHAKLFALHNHLVLDYWDYSFNYYYIDNKQQVHYVTFENTTLKFENNVVYDIPAHVERKAGHFNLCLQFPSSNRALVSDGTGYLHIVNTHSRNRPACRNQTWQTLHSTLVLGADKYFVIVDCRLQEKDNIEVIHCLLQSVEHNENNFNTVLTWVTFEDNGTTWKQTSLRQACGKGIVHYAAIETSCEALYIASDNPFKYTTDSEKEITNELAKMEPQVTKTYMWLQTTEDITISLKLQSNLDKKLFFVKVTPQNIQVSYAGNVFIDGKLKHKVDSELTTWNVQEGGQVDILITKSDSMIWDQLVEGGDPRGEQVMDASLIQEVHERLSHLCSETEVPPDPFVPGFTSQQLEECDAASEEDTVLVRLDKSSHEVTHRIPLSVHQFIFSVRIETREVPALALRHDVDTCVWQPYANLVHSETWPVKHQGTLSAFGYIQSSKQNRKFMTCPPNFSYSAVCEATRHLFIYQHASNKDCQLRKRTGGTMRNVKVGQQHLFNFDNFGEAIGINATNEFLFLLTEKHLIAIELY